MEQLNSSFYIKSALAVLVAAIWGFFPAMSKLGMLEIPPFAFLAVRYALTFLVFIPFAKVHKNDWVIISLFALLDSVINNGINFFAFQYLTPAASTLLLQTCVPIAVLMACLFAGESINLRQGIGIFISLAGVVTILGLPQMNLIGVAGIMLTRILWGTCEISFKGAKQLQPAAFLAYSSLIALPFMAGLSWGFEKNFYHKFLSVDWAFFSLTMSFQVFAMSAAMVIWQKLIARYGVSSVSPFALLQIIFGILSSVWLFGDKINQTTLSGAIMIAAGVIMSTRKPAQSRKEFVR